MIELIPAMTLCPGGGNTWDTIKPLGSYVRDVKRVVLVDDDAYKVGIYIVVVE